MTSPASGPIIVKPRIRSPAFSTSTFMKPALSSIVRVRRMAVIDSVATRTEMPRCRFALAQTHSRQRRVGEQAIWDETVACASTISAEVVPNDPKVVFGDVGELRAARTLPDRPNIWRRGRESIVDPDISPLIKLDAGQFEPDSRGVRRAPRGDKDVAAGDSVFAISDPHPQADAFSASPLYVAHVGRDQDCYKEVRIG